MLKDHPDRLTLANELHARPFPTASAPMSVAYLAITSQGSGTADRKALKRLLDGLGYSGKTPSGGHFFIAIGDLRLKWERHTEFVSYTLFAPKTSKSLFSDNPHDLFPSEWLAKTKGSIITSCALDVIGPRAQSTAEKFISQEFFKHFQVESLAVNYVLDRDAIVACDFVLGEDGNIRFCVIAIGQVGENRLGRIIQRLFEIETYKSLAMITLPIARDIFRQVGDLNGELTQAVQAIANGQGTSQDRLDTLLQVSAKIEYLQSDSAYRFSAVEAYGALVTQRISVLREERVQGRQTFSEFMLRRFDPAMRTCNSAQTRLRDLSARAARASDLLATRVTVRTNEQNRALLAQMDERASLQLRLQETVEGLSVVAISYYAVNLATYFLAPFAKILGLEKTHLTAALIIPMILCVWGLVRGIKKRATKAS